MERDINYGADFPKLEIDNDITLSREDIDRMRQNNQLRHLGEKRDLPKPPSTFMHLQEQLIQRLVRIGAINPEDAERHVLGKTQRYEASSTRDQSVMSFRQDRDFHIAQRNPFEVKLHPVPVRIEGSK